MKNRHIRVLWFVLMLVVFVIPHISNSLHFVIIKHEFGKRTNTLEYIDSSTIHYCEQYLFKTSPITELGVFVWEVFSELIQCIVVDNYRLSEYDQDNKFICVRGPPECNLSL